MLEENGKKSVSWGVIIAAGILALLSLGGLIWFFTASYTTAPIP